MISATQREVNCEAKVEHLAMPTSDLGGVTMIVLGDYWVAEASRNKYGV